MTVQDLLPWIPLIAGGLNLTAAALGLRRCTRRPSTPVGPAAAPASQESTEQ